MDEKTKKVMEGFARELEDAAGDNLVSIILYGSAARGDFAKGKSDLNFLVVLGCADEEALCALMKPVARYRNKGVGLPLVMEKDDIVRSLDSFPMEYLDMKSAYLVVAGEDVLGGLEIEGRDLRLQCEREAKGKLIQLRRGYLETGDKARDRATLFSQSIKAFLVIMRSMLWLSGADPAPRSGAEVVDAAARVAGRTFPYMKKALEFRAGGPRLAGAEARRLMAGYLEEAAFLADWIDSWVKREEGAP